MSDILRDFDKKNEFPKVKLNLPKFDFSHLTEAVKNMNTAFDNIAKDIRDRQDNAMAMEFTKCIGELLKKNGVVPKLTEYTRNFEADKTFETRYGVSIDELDFSEHDKVFEDKIARLESSYHRHRSKICDLENENHKLKQHIAELEEKNKNLVDMINELQLEKAHIDCDLHDANKQIAKLESKNNQLTESILRKETKIHELESDETSELPFDPLETANYLINATYERETSSLERAFAKVPDKVNSDRYTVDELEQIAEHLLVYCKHNKESE